MNDTQIGLLFLSIMGILWIAFSLIAVKLGSKKRTKTLKLFPFILIFAFSNAFAQDTEIKTKTPSLFKAIPKWSFEIGEIEWMLGSGMVFEFNYSFRGLNIMYYSETLKRKLGIGTSLVEGFVVYNWGGGLEYAVYPLFLPLRLEYNLVSLPVGSGSFSIAPELGLPVFGANSASWYYGKQFCRAENFLLFPGVDLTFLKISLKPQILNVPQIKLGLKWVRFGGWGCEYEHETFPPSSFMTFYISFGGSLGYTSFVYIPLPRPRIVSIFFKDQDGDRILEAGESGEIILTVENKGDETAKGVKINVKVEDEFKEWLEFWEVPEFSIRPYRKTTIRIPMKASPNLLKTYVRPEAKIKIEIEGKTITGERFSEDIKISASERPFEVAKVPEPETKPKVSAFEPKRTQMLPKELTEKIFKPRSKVFAVVVGISKYERKTIPEIKYAENDAIAFHKILTDQRIGGVQALDTRLLLGKEATLTKIKREIAWLLNQAQEPDSLAIFYYSGHGIPEKGEAYLSAYDTDSDYIEETALPLKEIKEKMKKVRGNVLMIFDSCFSGEGRSFAKAGAKGIAVVPKLGFEGIGFGKVILTASKADQISLDSDELRHGIFTYYLLEGLRGLADEEGDKDGWVEVDEVFKYASSKVRIEARKRGTEQEPEMIGFSKKLKITRNPELYELRAKEPKIEKIKELYEAGIITAEQLDKAVREIETGRESKILKDFLEGKISPEVFGRLYK